MRRIITLCLLAIWKLFFFGKKTQHHILVLDRYGKSKLSIKNGRIIQGGKITILEELIDYLESDNSEITPKVYLLNDLELVDYSSLIAASDIMDLFEVNLLLLKKPQY